MSAGRPAEGPATAGPEPRSLLSRLTHALVTPLGSVQISAELLARDPDGRLGERERRLVDNVRRATGEVQELLRQAGRLVKAQEGRLPLLVEEVPVHDALVDLERRLAPELEARRAALAVAATVPAARLLADRAVLLDVLAALVTALVPPAADAGPPVRVNVAPGLGPGGRPAAVFTVGGGAPMRPIGAAELEPFGGEPAAGTSGLELALARALAVAQGGELAPNDAEDGAFRLTVPLAGS